MGERYNSCWINDRRLDMDLQSYVQTIEGGCQVIGQKSFRSRGRWSEFSVENSQNREDRGIKGS
jgi:hypothetical protein